MLPKDKRIPRKEFLAAGAGRTAHGGHVSVRHARLPDAQTGATYAVVVSKKILPRAVDRNHVRRRIYSIIREYERSHAPVPGRYVFFCKKGTGAVSYADLREEVETLLG